MSNNEALQRALEASVNRAKEQQKPGNETVSESKTPPPVQAEKVPEFDDGNPEQVPTLAAARDEQAVAAVDADFGKVVAPEAPKAPVKKSPPPAPTFLATVFIQVTDQKVEVSFDGDADKLSPARLERATHIMQQELHKTHVALRRAKAEEK